MVTEGIKALYIETRNYGATAAFWSSLGFRNVFETDHGSGTWEHPSGGPYVFISEQHERDLELRPVLTVPNAAGFDPERAATYAEPFRVEHWGVMAAAILDPDGRRIGLEAPLPAGAEVPDAHQHHQAKYGK